MLHIALGLDAKYVMQSGVTITSICENNKDLDLFFHIATLGEGSDSTVFSPLTDILEHYNQQGEIIPIVDKYFEGLPELNYISKATYLRLLLPKVLKEDVGQVLYLDSDIIVMGSLRYFVEHPLSMEYGCGAAIDVNGCTIKHHNRLGISVPVTYFNAGVLQMNLVYWRNNDISSKTIQKIAENQYWFMDQDAINVVLNGKISRVPYKYNLQTSHYLYPPTEQELDIKYHQELSDAMNNPVIIHYASYRKPWQEDCPRKEYWEEYKGKTIWAKTQPWPSKPNDDTTQEWIKKARSLNIDLVNMYSPRFYKFICKIARSGKPKNWFGNIAGRIIMYALKKY